MAEYDFIILGAGPGGYTAAIRAAQLGAKALLVEKDLLGGVCLNWGCIPTKALYRSATLFEAMKKAESFGLECQAARADLAKMVARKNNIVDQLRAGIAQVIQRRKAEYRTGFGYVLDPHRVRLIEPGGKKEDFKAKSIIIATGTECQPHPVVAVDGRRVHDVKTALDVKEIPEKLFVIGGGVAGCEFAQIFHALGAEIIMTKRTKAPIKHLDADIEKTLLRLFKKRKYRLLLGDSITSVEVSAQGLKASLASGQTVAADLALISVGHTPLSYGLGLEEVGVEMDEKGHVLVDEHGRTNIESIYAIGDVTGRHLLAHYASHSGIIAVRHALGDEEAGCEPQAVPTAVFTDPELAWVGLTEAEARERFNQVKTGQFLFRALGRTVADGHLEGLIKIVAQGERDVVVGVHILGPDASSMIAEGTLAVARGLSIKDLAETIHAHPTYPEAMGEAAEDVHGLAVHKL